MVHGLSATTRAALENELIRGGKKPLVRFANGLKRGITASANRLRNKCGSANGRQTPAIGRPIAIAEAISRSVRKDSSLDESHQWFMAFAPGRTGLRRWRFPFGEWRRIMGGPP